VIKLHYEKGIKERNLIMRSIFSFLSFDFYVQSKKTTFNHFSFLFIVGFLFITFCLSFYMKNQMYTNLFVFSEK